MALVLEWPSFNALFVAFITLLQLTNSSLSKPSMYISLVKASACTELVYQPSKGFFSLNQLFSKECYNYFHLLIKDCVIWWRLGFIIVHFRVRNQTNIHWFLFWTQILLLIVSELFVRGQTIGGRVKAICTYSDFWPNLTYIAFKVVLLFIKIKQLDIKLIFFKVIFEELNFCTIGLKWIWGLKYWPVKFHSIDPRATFCCFTLSSCFHLKCKYLLQVWPAELSRHGHSCWVLFLPMGRFHEDKVERKILLNMRGIVSQLQ